MKRVKSLRLKSSAEVGGTTLLIPTALMSAAGLSELKCTVKALTLTTSDSVMAGSVTSGDGCTLALSPKVLSGWYADPGEVEPVAEGT